VGSSMNIATQPETDAARVTTIIERHRRAVVRQPRWELAGSRHHHRRVHHLPRHWDRRAARHCRWPGRCDVVHQRTRPRDRNRKLDRTHHRRRRCQWLRRPRTRIAGRDHARTGWADVVHRQRRDRPHLDVADLMKPGRRLLAIGVACAAQNSDHGLGRVSGKIIWCCSRSSTPWLASCCL
jgi:hypothetical protein